MNYIKELKKLEENGYIKMHHIEWWLMKYENKYKSVKRFIEKKESEEEKIWGTDEYKFFVIRRLKKLGFKYEDVKDKDSCEILKILRKEYETEQNFITFYEKLDDLSVLHRNETNSNKKINEYKSLNSNYKKAKWCLKNFDALFKVSLELYANYIAKNNNGFYIYATDKFKIYTSEFKCTISICNLYFDEIEYWYDDLKYISGIKGLYNIDKFE